jgi:hypothetical protein
MRLFSFAALALKSGDYPVSSTANARGKPSTPRQSGLLKKSDNSILSPLKGGAARFDKWL